MGQPIGEFGLDNLVCEASQPGIAPGFCWYELDYDSCGAELAHVAELPVGSRRIVATRRSAESDVIPVIRGAAGAHATHVQFESDGSATACAIVAQAHWAGIGAIPALHLRAAPASLARLRAAANEITVPGAFTVKVVYPAPTAAHASWAVELLGEWPHGEVPLSVTPAGSRQGRVAAALAGSRFVYAPLTSTSERMSAFWYRDLIVADATASDPGADTW